MSVIDTTRIRGIFLGLAVGFVGALDVWAGEAKPDTGKSANFEQRILPILKNRCYKCHGEGKVKGGLSLSSRAGLLQGGDQGPAISLDKPETSLLIQAIGYKDGLEMPPTGKLPADEIAALSEWVKGGAHFAPGTESKPAPNAHGEKKPSLEDGKSYWAYQPVRRPAPPTVKGDRWVRNPIDAFVLAKLEANGLRPNGPADKLVLLRRITYDLIGLPPTPAEVDQFLADKTDDAYPRLVDRLLASPQYGEKWGRHWLDLVRYAETNGYERDGAKPNAWRFRDYVIKSFNEDKPFDRFVREQLAGDEIPGFNPDALVATGFFRLGIWDDEPADPKMARFDEYDDIVTTTGQVFLGMTMNCARCHDHKIDPIPQTDYYRLVAFFRDVPPFSDSRDTSSRFNTVDITPPDRKKTYDQTLAEREAKIESLTSKMRAIEDAAIKKMPAEDQRAAEANDREQVINLKLKDFLSPEEKKDYNSLKRDRKKLVDQPSPDRELALGINYCLRRPPATNVLVRGSAHAVGAAVEPAFPAVLSKEPVVIPELAKDAKSSGRRTVLANWITSKTNPLAARVFVNRLWQHHFGKGIVGTPNDFGKFGETPTHPELLDWLATEFMAGEWKIKRMHRLLVLSNTYQMNSQPNPHGLKKDPANALLWRFNMRRLTAEEIRDSILAVTGQLNLKMGGPSVYPVIPREVLAGQSIPGNGWGKSPETEANRRSVYVYVKRSLLVPVLTLHDQADTDTTCATRYTTTVPTQALNMLNSEFMQKQAMHFANRLTTERPKNLQEQVALAIKLTAARPATEDERNRDAQFVQQLLTETKRSDLEALKLYCLLALNANEFVYVD